MRILNFDLIDQIDAEIQMHRLVAQDVLEFFRRADHLVLAPEAEHLHEADVEEQPFHDHVIANQIAQKAPIGLDRSGFEIGIRELCA